MIKHIFIITLLIFSLTACHNMIEELEADIGDEYIKVKSDSLVAAYIGGQTNIPSGKRNTRFEGHPLNAFYINKYETTYDLWYSVKCWAIVNGYVFDNEGLEGAVDECNNAPSIAKYKPVGGLNWWDCIIWCNAYSQMNGLTPVYYSDSSYSNVIKSHYTNNQQNSVYILSSSYGNTNMLNCKANGYRLPTAAEWTWAAHGGDPDCVDWNYKYAGSDEVDEVAVYDQTYTKPVSSKKANRLGLYDMCGNVCEWSYDAGLLGGSFGANSSVVSLKSTTWLNYDKNTGFSWFGFRIARNL